MALHDSRRWEARRLKDRIAPGARILFVGINPGVRSALTGHHFAGYSNRFWTLLRDARLVPEPLTHEDDARLPEFGLGITNLVPRPTPGIDTLRRAEYIEGWRALDRKIRRLHPRIVAFVGITLWRAVLPLLPLDDERRATLRSAACAGPQPVQIHGADVFVVPNPSSRNANFTYAEMLAWYRRLAQAASRDRKRAP